MTSLQEIHQFIRENFLFGKNLSFDTSTDLIESGIITDNRFLEFISFLEERFQISFTDDELLIRNFYTLEKINKIINQKKTRIDNNVRNIRDL